MTKKYVLRNMKYLIKTFYLTFITRKKRKLLYRNKTNERELIVIIVLI